MSEARLIIGADGLLGGTLRDCWRRAGKQVFATSFLPVSDSEGVQFLDLVQPAETWPGLPTCGVAVLCAAITNLDYCRRNSETTRHVNVVQTVRLAEQLARQGTFVIFISSNLVFDGRKPRPLPLDPICPTTEYGRQKAEAEKMLARLGQQAGVIRLTKVVHPSMPLIRGWRESLAQQKPITPYSDFICSPITLEAVMSAITAIAEGRLAGIWQLSASEDVSYADIAMRLARRWQADAGLVQPVSCRTNSALDYFPEHTTLEAAASEQRLGVATPEPFAAVDQAFPS